jgi:hypothetical protein
MSSAPAYELYHDDKMFRFWQTEVDLHYKFDMDAFKDSKLDVKPTVVQRKGKEAPPASTGSYDPFNRGDWATTPTRHTHRRRTAPVRRLLGGLDDDIPF